MFVIIIKNLNYIRLYVNGKYTFKISLLLLNQSHGLIIHMFLREFLLSKTKYYEIRKHTYSHISEMNITFISDLTLMTYKYYLQQPKSMMEWRLNFIMAKYPQQYKKLIRDRPYGPHPLIRKVIFPNEDDEDDGEN